MNRYARASLSVATGVVGALLGLVPWLVTDRRLPSQNIWHEFVMPEDMPHALMPLSQYYVVTIVAMVIVGAALAGALVRLTAARSVELQPWLVVVGVVAVQAVALAQSTAILRGGLEDSTRAQVYAYGMAAGIAVTIALGVLVLLGLARGGTSAITLALTASALGFTSWIPVLVMPFSQAWSTGMPDVVVTTASALSTWLPALVVGALIGWCGTSTKRRFFTSATALAALWVVPALITTVTHTLGSRILLQFPADLPEVAVRTFASALVTVGASQRIFVALAIAVVVAITMRTIRGGLPR